MFNCPICSKFMIETAARKYLADEETAFQCPTLDPLCPNGFNIPEYSIIYDTIGNMIHSTEKISKFPFFYKKESLIDEKNFYSFEVSSMTVRGSQIDLKKNIENSF